ncbi:DUF2284 domain-containing protein [Candidatus Omnitrophota bacterium]
MVTKIVEKVDDKRLQKDLEKYRQRALELGAADAKIITADMVKVDERVRAKCIYPKCRGYGTSANCPPYAMDIDQVRKVVNNFRYGIFFKVEIAGEKMADPKDKDERFQVRRKLHKMVAKIEAEAFYDGYYLALGFACGSCKGILCPDIECSALVPGQGCRHPYKARSSMEGAGMDAFIMATRVGWDVYPIGASAPPSEVPCGLHMGLVLIY